MKKIFIVLILVIMILFSCATTQTIGMYNWADYDNVSYKFLKNRTQEETQNIINCYLKMINDTIGTRNMPPPGVCADYGFLLIQLEKEKEGIRYLEMEKEYYPESSVFIDRIIKKYKET